MRSTGNVCLCFVGGQIELTWVQNGSDLKKIQHTKKKYTCCIIIILYQGGFKEQIEKFVKLLHYTTKNC